MAAAVGAAGCSSRFDQTLKIINLKTAKKKNNKKD